MVRQWTDDGYQKARIKNLEVIKRKKSGSYQKKKTSVTSTGS
jgi:hypothetical protein